MIEDYDRTAHTLPPLNVGTYVALQDPHNRWNRTGRIVEALADRQYRVRVDGSGRITLRNRRFLKLIQSKVSGTPIPSAMPPPPVPVTPTTHNPHIPLAPSPSTSHSLPLPPVLPPCCPWSIHARAPKGRSQRPSCFEPFGSTQPTGSTGAVASSKTWPWGKGRGRYRVVVVLWCVSCLVAYSFGLQRVYY